MLCICHAFARNVIDNIWNNVHSTENNNIQQCVCVFLFSWISIFCVCFYIFSFSTFIYLVFVDVWFFVRWCWCWRGGVKAASRPASQLHARTSSLASLASLFPHTRCSSLSLSFSVSLSTHAPSLHSRSCSLSSCCYPRSRCVVIGRNV